MNRPASCRRAAFLIIRGRPEQARAVPGPDSTLPELRWLVPAYGSTAPRPQLLSMRHKLSTEIPRLLEVTVHSLIVQLSVTSIPFPSLEVTVHSRIAHLSVA